MKLPVVLHKDPDSVYGVTIPDIPGCFSAGATVAQALDNTREALALHFEGLVADGDPLPEAKDIDAHMTNPDYQGGVGRHRNRCDALLRESGPLQCDLAGISA